MVHKENKHRFEKHPALVFTLVIIAGILIIDFVSAFFFIPVDYNSFRTHNPYYHHDLLPNHEAKGIWGERIFDIYTNSLGFKDKSCREVALQTNKRRIVFIGDSFTESMGMTWEESFPGMLAEQTPQAEILNAGVVSYSPKLYYLKVKYLLEQKKLKFDELFVFIDNSDPMNELTYRDFEPYNKKSLKNFRLLINRFLYHHSYIFYSISNKIITDRKSNVTSSWNPVSGESVLDEFSKEEEYFIAATVFWSYNPQAYEKWGKEGLALARDNMQKLTDLCRQYQTKLTVVIYPWPAMVLNKDLKNAQVVYWENFCMTNDLRFINLYPYFISTGEPNQTIRKYFITGDVHWNEEGNRYVASILYQYLLR